METSSIDENSKSYYTTPRLTTTFTPPASCLQPTFLLSPDGSDSASFETVKFNYANIYRGVYEQCYPPDYYLRTPFITTDGETDGVMRHYFSPGICPSGWLGAGTNVQESTSTIVCCPSGLNRTLSSDFQAKCSGTVTSPVIIQKGDTSTWNSSYNLLATPIIVHHHASDFTVPTSDVPDETSNPSAVSMPTIGPSQTFSTQATVVPDTPTLSTGERAGMGTGIGLAILAAVSLAAFFLVRRKKSASKRLEDGTYAKPELDGEGIPQPQLDEKDGTDIPLGAHEDVRAELDGGWVGNDITDKPV